MDTFKTVLISLFCWWLFFQKAFAQQRFWEKDSLPNTKKTWIMAASSTGLIGGLYIYTGISWYSNIPKTSFHFFDDSREWKQMDKIGHAWTAYQESKMVNELMTWAGHSKKTRFWTTALAGFCYQFPLEIMDGFTYKWGASASDLLANAAGSLLAASNILLFNKQFIQIKFSFHRTTYADLYPELFGYGLTSIFKDYNGQTYWLSMPLKPLLSNSFVPRWLNLAIGQGAEGLIGGYHNTPRSIIKQREFRQWFVSPDIQFSEIPTHSKILKILFFFMDTVHFPLPAFEINRKYAKWHWIYF